MMEKRLIKKLIEDDKIKILGDRPTDPGDVGHYAMLKHHRDTLINCENLTKEQITHMISELENTILEANLNSIDDMFKIMKYYAERVTMMEILEIENK